MMEQKRQLGVGFFLLAGLITLSIMVFMIGKDKGFLTRSYEVYARFADIRGVRRGAPVELSGIHVGYVKNLSFVKTPMGTQVLLALSVVSQYFPMIREDSKATISTKGVLGDKYIQIQMGFGDKPPVSPGALLVTSEGESLIDQLSNGGTLGKRIGDVLTALEDVLNQLRRHSRLEHTMSSIKDASHHLKEIFQNANNPNSAFADLISPDKNSHLNRSIRNVETSSGHLSSVLRKVDAGEGTIGALVNDPTLYEDLKVLMGGAKRSALLKYVVREALRNAEKSLPAPTTKDGDSNQRNPPSSSRR